MKSQPLLTSGGALSSPHARPSSFASRFARTDPPLKRACSVLWTRRRLREVSSLCPGDRHTARQRRGRVLTSRQSGSKAPILNHKTLGPGTGGEGSKKEQKGQIGKWCRPPMTGEGGGSWLDPMGRGAWFTEQTRGPGEPVRGGVQDRGRPKGNLGGVRTDGGG